MITNFMEVKNAAYKKLQGHGKKIACISILAYFCIFSFAIAVLLPLVHITNRLQVSMDEVYTDCILIVSWIVLILLCIRVFDFGHSNAARKLSNHEPVYVRDAFAGFAHPIKCIGLALWITFWTLCWACLFIVPAFMRSYRYQALYEAYNMYKNSDNEALANVQVF